MTLSRCRIFALSNRASMLKMISWSEYFTIMAVFYGLYFGWWLLKYYYPKLKGIKIQAFGHKRSGTADSKEPRTAGSEKTPNESPVAVTEAKGVQQEKAGGPGEDFPVSQPEGPGNISYPLPVPFMADLAQQQEWATKLAIEVVRLAEKAVKEQWPVENLAGPFRELLAKEPFCRLRGTHFQVKIVQRIVQELTKGGSIQVDAKSVSGWWV
jgi:hypothetical protein